MAERVDSPHALPPIRLWFVRAGLNGSRTRPISDFLADNGYYVILPDIYEGTQFEEHGGFASPGKFSEEVRGDLFGR